MPDEIIPQPAGLISVLLEPQARRDERDDAAMDLSAFDSPDALAALIRVATCTREDAVLLDSCGQSVAEIWLRRGHVDVEALDRMAAPAQKSAIDTLAGTAAHLLPFADNRTTRALGARTAGRRGATNRGR